MCCFPRNVAGRILDYDNQNQELPTKILEMGLLPQTHFMILYQAPFGGPLYVEFGSERTRVALREEEARYILVEPISNAE